MFWRSEYWFFFKRINLLAAQSLWCCSAAFLCSLHLGLLVAGAPPVAEHRLQACGLNSCSTWTRHLWCPGLVALWHVGSSWTRDWAPVPCIGRWILNHWTTREVPPGYWFLINCLWLIKDLIAPHGIIVLVRAVLSHFSHVWLFATPWTVAPPGFSVPGILQARMLEWVAMPASRGSSWPRDQTRVSCLLPWQAGSVPLAPPIGKPAECCHADVVQCDVLREGEV